MTNTCRLVVSVTILFCLYPALAADKEFIVEPSAVLKTLDKGHPRLMLKDKDLQALKKQYAKDKVLQKCLQDVLKQADGYIDRPVLTYRKIGPRLLSVSRACVHRIYHLGLAYRWTGEKRYADKAVDNLLNQERPRRGPYRLQKKMVGPERAQLEPGLQRRTDSRRFSCCRIRTQVCRADYPCCC